MATQRQIAANRENALRSTGPRSIEGKRASASNAVKHGLTAREILLATEDPEEFNSFLTELRSNWSPAGALERALVDRMGGIVWRLERAVRMETGTLARHVERGIADRAQSSMNRIRELIDDPDKITDPEEAIALLHEGQSGAEALQRLLGPEFSLSAAFANALGEGRSSIEALQRYEVTLERSLGRTLHTLQRLQAIRRGDKVPPAIPVDVTT